MTTTQPTTAGDVVRRLRRTRGFVRGCFWTGVLVSLTANVLHADPNPISQAVAAWAPLALLLAVELLSRVPVTGTARSWLRMSATTLVAAIAAWVSYWHMVAVATEYGEAGLIPYLLPVSVDGLVVIASISLVEVNHRIHHHSNNPAQPDTTTTTAAAAAAAGEHPVRAESNHHRQALAGPPALTDTAAALAARFNSQGADKVNGTPYQQEALL